VCVCGARWSGVNSCLFLTSAPHTPKHVGVILILILHYLFVHMLV